jgi:hypothetical protein
MTAELIVSVLALAVAVGSAIATWRVSQRQTLVQEQMLELESRRERYRLLEQGRAAVRASIRQESSSDWRLIVTNDGPSQARALRVLVDGESVGNSEHVIGGGTSVTTLGAGADIGYRLLVYMSSPDTYSVELEWEDDSGRPGRWGSELAI